MEIGVTPHAEFSLVAFCAVWLLFLTSFPSGMHSFPRILCKDRGQGTITTSMVQPLATNENGRGAYELIDRLALIFIYLSCSALF